ncbi:MAG: aminodeoxychorismate synthase, component I, partial [Gammaproteobacteria bacterium]
MTLIRPLHADIDLLALHRLAPQRYPALFESTASGTAHGRWDLLLVGDGTGMRLDGDGRVRDLQGGAIAGDFLEALDTAWRAERLAAPATPGAPPFRGGWALLLDYELAAQVEPVLALPARADARPAALALRCPAALLRDRNDGTCFVVAEAGRAELIERIVADLEP